MALVPLRVALGSSGSVWRRPKWSFASLHFQRITTLSIYLSIYLFYGGWAAVKTAKGGREGGMEGKHPDYRPCSTAHTWGRPGIEVPGTHRLIVNMKVWEPFCSSRWNVRISRCCVGFSLQSLIPGGLNRFLQKQQLLRSYCELFFFFFLNSFFFFFFPLSFLQNK